MKIFTKIKLTDGKIIYGACLGSGPMGFTFARYSICKSYGKKPEEGLLYSSDCAYLSYTDIKTININKDHIIWFEEGIYAKEIYNNF